MEKPGQDDFDGQTRRVIDGPSKLLLQLEVEPTSDLRRERDGK